MYKEGQPRVHYAPSAGGDRVAYSDIIRTQFAHQHGNACFDVNTSSILDKLAELGHHYNNYVIVNGMADYSDGRRNMEWQPYAALTAAAFTKILLQMTHLEKKS